MVLEITTLASAVGATVDLLKQAKAAAELVRSGLGANNDEAKQALTDKLEQLDKTLANVGTLGRMAEQYVRSHEQVFDLLGETKRAQRLLVDNVDDFSDSANARYSGSWRVMETVFSEIDAKRGPVLEAVNNRTSWFSERDRDQIGPLLLEFEAAYRSTTQAVRYKASSDLRLDLEQIIRPLETAETLLRNTLYGGILPAIQSVGTKT